MTLSLKIVIYFQSWPGGTIGRWLNLIKFTTVYIFWFHTPQKYVNVIWSTTAWSGPPSPTRYTSSEGTLINWWTELNTKNSTKRQQSCRLVEFLVLNSAFGRNSNELIPSTLSSVGVCHVEVFISWWFSHRRLPMVKSSYYEDFNMTIANWW